MEPNQEQLAVQAQIEQPKGSTNIYELPCGYLAPDGQLHTEVVLREMTGHEEDLLASKKTQGVKKMNELYSRCITRLGTLTEKAQIHAAVPDLLTGDRVFLMFAVRRTTLGDEYAFKHRCPACEKDALYIVDLSEMKIQKMVDPRKRIFDGQLSTGKAVRWRPLNGRDEARMADLANSGDNLSIGMMLRLEILDGRPPSMDGIKALSSRERNELRSLFDESDGGVDTEVEMTCPKCEHQYTTDTDVGQAGFFFPSVTQKNSKKRSST